MTRPATYDERRKWGTCPVCKAADGQVCKQDSNEWSAGNTWPNGAHARRLSAAPLNVRVVVTLEAA